LGDLLQADLSVSSEATRVNRRLAAWFKKLFVYHCYNAMQ